MALSVGLIVLVLWLAALAGGAQTYDCFLRIRAVHGPSGCCLHCGWWRSCTTSANGIRHLFWDAGKGLERDAGAAQRADSGGGGAVVSLLLLLGRSFGKGAA